ncbi:MAG: hypothetical protein C0498_01525 [Anaerolinea sp.]|nr:hypothetical protein [Anaerolinea sp.]
MASLPTLDILPVPGGIIVLSPVTLPQAEGEQLVNFLRGRHPGLQVTLIGGARSVSSTDALGGAESRDTFVTALADAIAARLRCSCAEGGDHV